MYHKGNRESVECLDDIVLIQASGVENDSAVQDLKVSYRRMCQTKDIAGRSRQLVKSKVWSSTVMMRAKMSSMTPLNRRALLRYSETTWNVSFDVRLIIFSRSSSSRSLVRIRWPSSSRKGLADRYITRMNSRKLELQDDNAYREVKSLFLALHELAECDCLIQFLWTDICDELLNEINQESVTLKLITKLMYSFRDIQVRVFKVFRAVCGVNSSPFRTMNPWSNWIIAANSWEKSPRRSKTIWWSHISLHLLVVGKVLSPTLSCVSIDDSSLLDETNPVIETRPWTFSNACAWRRKERVNCRTMFFAYVDEFTRINLPNRLVKIKTRWRKPSTGIEKALLLIRISSEKRESESLCIRCQPSF